MSGQLVARITVERRIDNEGHLIDWFEAKDGNDDSLPLVETLGMLRLAEDTAIRDAMGEADA